MKLTKIYEVWARNIKNLIAESFHILITFAALHEEQNSSYFKYKFVKYGVPQWQQCTYNFLEFLAQKLFSIFLIDSVFQLGGGGVFEYVKTEFLMKLEFLSELIPNKFDLIR